VVEALSILAAVAVGVQTAALVILHLLPTGSNPIRDAVSDYGVGRYRGWFWDSAVAAGGKPISEVAEEHGWQLGRVVDPFGHEWEIGRTLGAWPPEA
jgi:hypothetical protein